MAEQRMVKKPTTHIVKDATGAPTGYACNGCGYVVPAPVAKCPKCGDDQAPVFSKLR